MKSFRKWLAIIVAGLVLCGIAVWLLCQTDQPITLESYEQLQPGMTREDVSKRLGRSGRTRDQFVRWLNNRTPRPEPGTDLLNDLQNPSGVEYWFGDRGVVVIRFDADHRIADKQFLHMKVSTSDQWLVRVREWMGR